MTSLFSYSGSIALNGIAGAVLVSLPAMLLARLGYLALVPVYNFSYRGPSLINMLARRTTHAFYPGLQRYFVAGDHERFKAKYREINLLSVAISMIAAGTVLAGNRSLIGWLAGPDFYAGAWTNVWFAMGAIISPLVSGFMNLLQYSGSMGKVAWVTILQTLLGLVLGYVCYNTMGFPGLAAAFMLLPVLLQGPYALLRGARNCGFRAMELSGSAITVSGIVIAFVILAGTWIASHPSVTPTITLFGRQTSLPNSAEWMTGIGLAVSGAWLALRQLKRIKDAEAAASMSWS